MTMKSPELPITVCPSCNYGFRDTLGPGDEFVCPRTERGHRWEAIRAVHGTGRRRGIAEFSVLAGGAPMRLLLNSGETVIGREEGCGLVLDNLSVSRRHAGIQVDADGGAIEDMDSSCWTAFNSADCFSH